MSLFGPKQAATLRIGGMTCGSCRRHVEEALRSEAGVASATVDLAAARAEVAYDPEKTGLSALIAAVRRAGYGAEPADATAERTP